MLRRAPESEGEADANQDVLEESGVAQRTDVEEDRPDQPPSQRGREDPISSSKDERLGVDKRIIRRPPSPSPGYDCRDVGCRQLGSMHMEWTCGETGETFYELGLPTGKAVWSLYDLSNIFLDPSLAPNARVVPYIAPCMGGLHHDPVSDGSLALMKGWIDDCRHRGHRHQLCMTSQPVHRHGPKRLLKCLSDGSVRLETQSTTQPCGYIALSYCWGDGNDVKKTTEKGPNKTLDLHQRGIPNKDLPPLFQEVVALARGVNIPYLWIDSLCIIQDSQENKEEEMKQMSDIYSGALVVVVAALGSSPLDSLLAGTWRTASLIRYEEMDLHVKFRKIRL